MNCPRCKSPITQSIAPDSIITCPGCGARLMTRSAAMKSQEKMKAEGVAPPAASAKADEASPAADAKGPPEAKAGESRQVPAAPDSAAEAAPSGSEETPEPASPDAAKPPLAEADEESSRPAAPEEPPPPEAPQDPRTQTSPPEASEASSPPKAADLPPSATLPPTPAMLLGTRPEGDGVGGPSVGPAMMELLLRELQHLRANQEKMLELLGQRPSDTAWSEPEPETPDDGVLQPVRSRRRKTVLLIDDDPMTRDAAVAELEQADVPVRAVDEGNEALRLIAEEKPDVVALELALGGEMAGKDLINTLKATMEWVDIPIILWTRESVSTQKEARVNHGADELVQKESGAAALVARVITLFRRA